MAASRSAVMPSDSVSIGTASAPEAFIWSNKALAQACRAQAATKSIAGSGIAIRPRSTRRGKRATSAASASASPGATPDLFAPPSILTCRQTCNGGSSGGRCSLRRWAIFRRSTDCAQSKCSATPRVLLLWMGPMQCHSSIAAATQVRAVSSACQRRKASIFSTPSAM